jgi:hypothetical protein
MTEESRFPSVNLIFGKPSADLFDILFYASRLLTEGSRWATANDSYQRISGRGEPSPAFERLESIAGKLARCVLRRRGGSNVALLPEQVEGIGKGDIRGQVRFVADLFNVAA